MKDKILEAVQISKTYGEGESAVQALKASDLTIWERGICVHHWFQWQRKIHSSEDPGRTVAAHDRKRSAGWAGHLCNECRAACTGAAAKNWLYFSGLPAVPGVYGAGQHSDSIYLDHRTPDEQMLRKLTEILGIAEKLDARPSQISGGQQQRVAIARALIGKPRIVFADEPTGNLDTRTGEDTMKLLTECAAEFGQTLIVVTHNPEIAKKAQQIIRIEDGCIIKGL